MDAPDDMWKAVNNMWKQAETADSGGGTRRELARMLMESFTFSSSSAAGADAHAPPADDGPIADLPVWAKLLIGVMLCMIALDALRRAAALCWRGTSLIAWLIGRVLRFGTTVAWMSLTAVALGVLLVALLDSARGPLCTLLPGAPSVYAWLDDTVAYAVLRRTAGSLYNMYLSTQSRAR